jgi:small-conductance mechanosensitive channel/CRP-like cAMP-binding protein
MTGGSKGKAMAQSTLAKGKGWSYVFVRLAFPAMALIAIAAAVAVFKPVGRPRSYLEAAFVFFAAFFAVRLADAVFYARYVRKRRPYPLPNILRGFILAVFYLVFLFVVLKNVLRVDITPFLATSAILTMVLGLAFQGVLSNILSGLSLHFTKSFARGDWVGIGSHEGVIVDTNWRETRLLDRMSNVIVLPNNTVASEIITNYSQPDKKTALVLTFKISSAAPASDVIQVLLEAARDCPDVADIPAPQAYITSYDEFGISYLLKFWVTEFARKNPIIGEVGRLAWYKMRRKGIEIAVSVGDRLKDIAMAIEKSPAAVRRGEGVEERRERTYLDLLHSSFLRYQQGEKAGQLIVSQDEIAALAPLVRRSVYAKGEVLFRQGEKGTSCFIVARGKIRGEIAYEESGKSYVSDFTVGPGGIFGEMSLFSGMPRTATGIIAEESELLEIEAAEFAVLLERNPALAETIAEIVSSRNEQNMEFLRKIKELSEKDVRDSASKKTILEYLKSFVRALRR